MSVSWLVVAHAGILGLDWLLGNSQIWRAGNNQLAVPMVRRRHDSQDRHDRRQRAGLPALLTIILDRDDDMSLHAQLTAQVRERILDGRLPAGTRLPSTRRWAEDLGVSRTVTLTAAEQLAADGYVVSRPAAGLYVADLPERPAGDRPVISAPGAPAPVVSDPGAGPAGLRLREDRPLDPTGFDPMLFPGEVWARLSARAWRSAGVAALRAPAAGLPALRAAIAGHLLAFRGIRCQPARIIITAGVVDAVGCIARLVLTPGDRVWLETPGFRPVAATLAAAGLDCRAVPVDSGGLPVESATAGLPPARLVIATPARHFPTGVVLPLARRLRLLDWARDRDAWLVEDDYDSEIRYAGRPVAALTALDASGRTFYIGSFSNLLFPGLRLGYLVIPPALADRTGDAAEAGRRPASVAPQPALAAFIDDGHMATHLRRLRQQLRRRRDRLLTMVADAAPAGFVPWGTDLGMSLLLRADAAAAGRVAPIVARARTAGLGVRRLAGYDLAGVATVESKVSTEQWEGILVGYAGTVERDLIGAASRLIHIIMNHQSP